MRMYFRKKLFKTQKIVLSIYQCNYATFKKLLCKKGMNINGVINKDGETLLMCIINSMAVVIDTEEKNETDIFLNMIKLLLNQPNIDINATNHKRETALHIAVLFRNKTVINILFDKPELD